jgi:hypothetical protein
MSKTRSIVGRFLICFVAAWNIDNTAPSAVAGGLLLPNDFVSQAPSLTESGNYTVDTSAGVMYLPDGSQVSGVFSSGVAVFTFGSIDINGAIPTTFTVLGSNPFALLSQTNLTLDNASLDVSASGTTPGPGGNNPAGQGVWGGWSGGGGGGFGTAGGNGGVFVPNEPPPGWVPYSIYAGGAGGASYGGLSASITGGGGGGGWTEGQGGGGGGAVELGATGTLTLIDSAISANGGAGQISSGGGAGGDISLLGNTINLDGSTLSAVGGAGGDCFSIGGPSGGMIGAGGQGGAGRLDIETYQLNDSAGAVASSGAVVEIASIPEPSSLLTLAIGSGGVSLVCVIRRAKKRPNARQPLIGPCPRCAPCIAPFPA